MNRPFSRYPLTSSKENLQIEFIREMTMIVNRKAETGQALILIVLGILGMLAFAALAIDGGRIYTDRRAMQNASDTSSLTGAGSIANYLSANQIFWKNWVCGDTWFNDATAQAYSDAINRAAANGYSIDTDVSDGNGVTATCGTEVHTGFTDKYIDVTTYITADTDSSFAKLVYGGALRQTVISTARIRPQTAGGYGHAIVALNPAACDGNNNGAIFDGNDDVFINGGGVFSNGCFRANGSSLHVDVTAGVNTFIEELDTSGSPTIDPWPTGGDEPLPDDTFTIPAPDCSGLPSRTYNNGDSSMDPGRYITTTLSGGGPDIVMNPGLYCFEGRFRINGGVVSGDFVTIYMVFGDFLIAGGPTVDLTAPLPDPDPSPAIPGVVLYLAEGNTGEAALLGNSESSYLGTVYAPDGEIEVGGTAGINPTYSTQLIGWNVSVHGTAEIVINFDNALVYQLPPRMDLQE
jgi:hypothetical protein